MDTPYVVKPSPLMKKLYVFYFVILVFSLVVSWSVPLAIFLPESLEFIVLLVWLPTLIIAVLFFVWLDKYYRSIEYVVEDKKIISRRGVWWKVESSVPIGKVNNIKWKQGPLQRLLGLASLQFHTAAMGTPIPEISFNYLEADKAERIRKDIFLKLGKTAEASSEERTGDVFYSLLGEVRLIRKILEEKLVSS